MDQGTQRLITRHNEQMRELIVRDIDALENKLNVKRQVSSMADDAVDKVKGTLGMNNRNPNEGWGDFVRHNAAPLAAIGLGGTLLARNLRTRMETHTTTVGTSSEHAVAGGYTGTSGAASRTYDDGNGSSGMKDRASSVATSVQDTASTGVSSAKEKVSGATSMVGDKASHAKDTVSTHAVHAKDVVVERIPSRDEARRMAHDHSQLLGVAALAAGAVAGAFIPRSRAEKEKLAPVQSSMKDKASDLVETGVEKAKETADRAAEAVRTGAETAKEEFSDQGSDDSSASSSFDDDLSGDTPRDTTPDSLPTVTQPNRITGGSGSMSGGGTRVRPTTTTPSAGDRGGTI